MADHKSGISVDAIYNRSVGVPDSANAQKLTISGTSATSTALKGNATFEISCDTTCHICFSESVVVATSDHPWFFAGSEKIIHTGYGTDYLVSAIQDTTGGTMFITELLPDRLG